MINFRLIGIKLGEGLKSTVSLGKIDRIATAIFGFSLSSNPPEDSEFGHYRQFDDLVTETFGHSHIPKDIASMRSQRIYEWVVAFAERPMDRETKLQLLQEFINCLTPEGSSSRNLIKETDAFSDRKRDIGRAKDDTRPYYYQLLDVSTDASQDEIKEAYHRHSMLYHPDKSTDPDANEKMKKINEAYAVLSDPDKRARHGKFEKSFNG
jgi:hypothetical protein